VDGFTRTIYKMNEDETNDAYEKIKQDIEQMEKDKDKQLKSTIKQFGAGKTNNDKESNEKS
jgi:hypothetical protein